MIVKYNHFLREGAEAVSTRSRDVSTEEAAAIIRERCPQFNPNSSPLYFRGRWNAARTGCVVTDPAGFERKSLSGFSHYNMLLDNLPSWKDYPRRDKSIMFLNDEFSTADYGTSFLVFPLDSPAIAVTPRPDIFDAFTSLKIQAKLSITELSAAMEYYKVRVTSWSDMCDDMDELWARILRGGGESPSHQLKCFNELVLRGESWRGVLDMLLDPKANGFSLATYDGQSLKGLDSRTKMAGYQATTLKKYAAGSTEGHDNFMPSEFWAATACLMVDVEQAGELLSALKNNITQ